MNLKHDFTSEHATIKKLFEVNCNQQCTAVCLRKSKTNFVTLVLNSIQFHCQIYVLREGNHTSGSTKLEKCVENVHKLLPTLDLLFEVTLLFN